MIEGACYYIYELDAIDLFDQYGNFIKCIPHDNKIDEFQKWETYLDPNVKIRPSTIKLRYCIKRGKCCVLYNAENKIMYTITYHGEKNTLEDFLEHTINLYVKLNLPLKIDVAWIRKNNIEFINNYKKPKCIIM